MAARPQSSSVPFPAGERRWEQRARTRSDSARLNELGFMSYVGGHLSSALEGIPWPAAYVALVVLYVLMHYLFVSQSSQVLALLGVFVEVGTRTGVPAPLMAFALLFASSYFSTITPQGGSQNVIFVGSGYSHKASCTGWGLSPRASASWSFCCWARRGFSWSSAEEGNGPVSRDRSFDPRRPASPGSRGRRRQRRRRSPLRARRRPARGRDGTAPGA